MADVAPDLEAFYLSEPVNDPYGETDEVADDPETAPEPYTDEDVAQIAAGLSAFGLPIDNVEAYIDDFSAKIAPRLAPLEVGEALDEYGINKGTGAGALPPYARLAIAGGAIALTAIPMRRKYAAPLPASGARSSNVTEE